MRFQPGRPRFSCIGCACGVIGSLTSALDHLSLIKNELNFITNTDKLVGRQRGNTKCRKTLGTVRKREQVLPIAVVRGPWASKLGLGLIGRGYDASPRPAGELSVKSQRSRGVFAASFMAGGPLDQKRLKVVRG